MIYIVVKDHTIMSEPEKIFVIENPIQPITVIGQFSKTSLVYCHIKGLSKLHSTILFFKEVTKGSDDFCTYEGAITVTDAMLTANGGKPLAITVSVDENTMKGEQLFVCNNSAITAKRTIQDDTLRHLIKKVNELEQIVASQRTDKDYFKRMGESRPGMVPKAVDTAGNYIWDFPYSGLEEKIKQVALILSELSDAFKESMLRIQALEKIINEHLNQEGYI